MITRDRRTSVFHFAESSEKVRMFSKRLFLSQTFKIRDILRFTGVREKDKKPKNGTTLKVVWLGLHIQSAENHRIFPSIFRLQQSRPLRVRINAIRFIFFEAEVRTFEIRITASRKRNQNR